MLKYITSIIITISYACHAIALEDDLQKTATIAAHSIKVHAQRMKVAAENLANEDTTSQTPGGSPYRRKIIFAENVFDRKLKTDIVKIKRVSVDKAPFIIKYDPNHPSADINGYVKYPNIRKEIERADANEAQRSYEANLSIIEMSRAMMQHTIEAIK